MRKIYLVFILLLSVLTTSAQWGGEYGVQPKPMGTSDYGTEYVITPDGTIWFYYYHPTSTSEDSLATAVYEMRLQAISKDGKLLLGDKGKVVSSYLNASFTVVNQYICANSDNTVTLVVRDCRNSTRDEMHMSYTAYRFRTDGTSVWDEEGVNIDEAMATDFTACMTFCELSDGCTALAWTHECSDGGSAIEIQKLSKDGKCMYKLDNTRLSKENGVYTYPYMVPSDNGSFILVYAYTSNYYLRAMKFNADGTKAWPAEVKVYGGGWGSIMALQSRMQVYPTPDNGVVVTWSDDRNSDDYYAPYLAYIKSDGTSVFTNEKGKPDLRLSYEEYSAHPPKIVFSKDGNDIYAIFDQFSQNVQSFQQLSIQKVNKNGELLYGENGAQVVPIDNQSLGYPSIQLGEDGKLICFWQDMISNLEISNLYSIRDEKTGKALDEENPYVEFRAPNAYRAGLTSAYSQADNTILLYWQEDAKTVSSDSETGRDIFIKMTPAGNEVGTPAAINTINKDKNSGNHIYNVMGQIMSSIKKGDLYIMNGKKYIKH